MHQGAGIACRAMQSAEMASRAHCHVFILGRGGHGHCQAVLHAALSTSALRSLVHSCFCFLAAAAAKACSMVCFPCTAWRFTLPFYSVRDRSVLADTCMSGCQRCQESPFMDPRPSKLAQGGVLPWQHSTYRACMPLIFRPFWTHPAWLCAQVITARNPCTGNGPCFWILVCYPLSLTRLRRQVPGHECKCTSIAVHIQHAC